MRVVYVEKRDWRLELNKYFLVYCFILYIMIGQSLVELLFGRKLFIKLLEVVDLEEFEDLGYQQVRDCDVEKKQVGVDYVDKRYQVVEKCI